MFGGVSRIMNEQIPPMPIVNTRRPFDDDKPDGYLESLNDWYHNNEEAVEWFLTNAEAIRKAITHN